MHEYRAECTLTKEEYDSYKAYVDAVKNQPNNSEENAKYWDAFWQKDTGILCRMSNTFTKTLTFEDGRQMNIYLHGEGEDAPYVEAELVLEERPSPTFMGVGDIFSFLKEWKVRLNSDDVTYTAVIKAPETVPAREFYVDTPLGKLHVYTNTDDDCPESFPGVYVELVNDTFEYDELLAVVEYNSCGKHLQTCVYGDLNADEPTDVTIYDLDSCPRKDGD